MLSRLFLDFQSEHNRLLALAMAGDPPKTDLKNFWRRLNTKKSDITDMEELRKIDYYIDYWRGFFRQSGEFEALNDGEVERRRPSLF